jgi:RNA polymerase sigma factor (sigma-70 family)
VNMHVSKECIDGCLKANQAAQRELFDALLPYLNAICRRYLNNTSLSRDVLQDSFITIFDKIAQYNAERGAIHSWCSRIVINNCLKQNNRSNRFFEFNAVKHERSVAAEVEGAMNEEDLVQFLRQMPEKFYEVFMLFVVEGFSHDEIAEMLGISTELSRKRLARARAWINEKPSGLSALVGDVNYIIS